ncbi:MAG: hypothetical protein A2284_15525 [Deltaproteobacteria bacterium RIFOXYA12_FULL_61_11]|nr:MAG: hypothetical protein A2284_15525 [Deltaproteobacteria bacterium RIFOXYA12_FULL_61_11]
MRSWKIQHNGPVSGRFSYCLGRIVLTLLGWRVEGSLPLASKFVLIGAPHTSNWDFILTMATTFVLRLHISWLGKASLFRGPLGYLMRRLGGIPIDRSSSHGVVETMYQRFVQSDSLVIAMAPSGTRGKVERWHSGFYWLACKANVPLVLGYMDYARKEMGIGPSFTPTGDIPEDMDRIRTFYATIRGKHPEREAPVRLKEECNRQ